MRISDWSSDVCSSDLFGRLRDDRHRSGRKTLAQRAKSGDLEVKRRATWGMSDGNGSDPDRMRVMRSCRWTGRLGGATRDRRSSLFDIACIERGHHRDRTDAQAITSGRSEEHTSELQSLMRISYAVFCLKKKKQKKKPS